MSKNYKRRRESALRKLQNRTLLFRISRTGPLEIRTPDLFHYWNEAFTLLICYRESITTIIFYDIYEVFEEIHKLCKESTNRDENYEELIERMEKEETNKNGYLFKDKGLRLYRMMVLLDEINGVVNQKNIDILNNIKRNIKKREKGT